MKDGLIVIGFVLLTLACYLFGVFLGFQSGKTATQATMQQQAVDAGVAEWTVDQKTGVKGFKFKSVK